MDGWQEFVKKKVYVKLKNGREYSGTLLKISDKGSCSIVLILDKFGQKVGFYDSEIEVLQEQRQ